MKTKFLTRELSNFHHLYCQVLLTVEVILSIYCFKRDNFLSENVILNVKQSCIQSGHHLSSDHGYNVSDIRRVERLGPLPPDIQAEDC